MRQTKAAAEPVLTRAPELLEFVEAVYPPDLLKEQREGAVDLEIEIDALGLVSQAQVVRADHPAFGEAALAAVKAFKFLPAEVDGKAAPVRIVYTYRFAVERKVEEVVPEGEDVVNLAGRVREGGVKLPIAEAQITVVDLGLSAKADDKGRFSFTAVPPGHHKIRAEATGFQAHEVEVEVKEAERADVVIALMPLALSPYETVVRGKREEVVVSRVSLRQKEMTTVPGTFGDPIRAIQSLPGMSRSPYAVGVLLVRGAPPSDSGVYLDGVRIPLLFHFLGGPSVLNAELLERIDYFPGNFSVRFGRAMAGIVEVNTRYLEPKEWHGMGKIDLTGIEAFVQAPIGDKVSVAVAARRSYIDVLLPLVLDVAGAENVSTMAPVYWDYQVRTDVRLNPHNKLSFLAFGSDDELEMVTTNDDKSVDMDLGARTGFHRLKAEWWSRFDKRTTNSLSPSVGYDMVTFETEGSTAYIDVLELGLRDELTLDVSKRVSTRFGLDLEGQFAFFEAELPVPMEYYHPGRGGSTADMTASFFGGETETVSRTIGMMALGWYLEATADLGAGVTFVPGLRWDYHHYSGTGRLAVAPRMALRWEFLPGSTIKAGAGLFYGAPQPQQVDPEYGNPDLDLPWAEQYSLGFEQRITDDLSLDIQGYFIQRHGLVLMSGNYDVAEDGSFDPEFYTNGGFGRSYGMEVLLRHNVSKYFYGWLAYTLSRSEQKNGSNEDFFPTFFDQTHIMTLVASFLPGAGWELGLRFRLVTGNPTTPRTGYTFDSDSDSYAPVLGERRSDRLPTFHQLDIRVEKKWTFQAWALSVYLDIQNVYWAANSEFVIWDYRSMNSSVLPGLPFLPTIGVKGMF